MVACVLTSLAIILRESVGFFVLIMMCLSVYLSRSTVGLSVVCDRDISIFSFYFTCVLGVQNNHFIVNRLAHIILLIITYILILLLKPSWPQCYKLFS